MNQQEQIKKLEESNRELQRQIELQAKQIEEMKSISPVDKGSAPYKGAGWAIINHDNVSSVVANPGRVGWYAYATREQAEWEVRATEVRRRLQRICAALGPAKPEEPAYCVVVGYHMNGYPRQYNAVWFTSSENAETAERILGDELKYLDWNNSPEAQDAIAGNFK